MRKFFIGLGLAASMIFGMASTSVAADIRQPYMQRYVVEEINYRPALAGFYLGGQYSYNRDNFLGVFAGYNFDISNIILGIETDFNYNLNQFRSNWDGSTRARLGYNYNNFVPFVSGGLAYKSEFNKVHVGYTAGAGLEYHMNNWFARVEYRYANFNSAFIREDHSVRSGIGYRF